MILKKKGGGGDNATGITDNKIAPDVKTHNQSVLERFHEELLKLINRNNIMFGTTVNTNTKSKVGECYCTPNGIFVVKLTKTNCGLVYLQSLQNQLQEITNNGRIKEFLKTNNIEYNDKNTIGDLVFHVMKKCTSSTTKLKHIKQMNKSKERELAEQYRMSNLLEKNDDSLLSDCTAEEKSLMIQRAEDLSKKKVLRQQNIPFYERFFDKINRLWFRWRFRGGYKGNYNNLCKRDWDTGKLTR